MKKTYISILSCYTILSFVFVIFLSPDSKAQINAASWIGYNSYTDAFPIAASATSPALISSASVNFKGLLKSDDSRSEWKSENAKPDVDIKMTPYLSFSLKLLTSRITFDKFVLKGLAFENKSTKAQLRWSIDGYAISIGEFTAVSNFNYSLTSVDLSSLPQFTGKTVEFRVYYYNGKGNISHSDTGRYASPDGTPDAYAHQDGFASIWVKYASVSTSIEQFRGKFNEGDIGLKWHTSTEQNISHFEIERSTDGVSFFNVGKVVALGLPAAINKYHFTDRTIKELSVKMVFYRLWMLDTNGNASYTNTVPIVIKNDESLVYLSNPLNDMATIVISSTKQEAIRYSIMDSKYKMILTGRYALVQGSNTLHINVENFSRGTYTLHVNGSNTKSSLQFVK